MSLEAGKQFLEANAKKEGVVTTASGLQYKVVQAGTGAHPKASDTVQVHYRGTFIDGKTFDSSYDRGQPISFPLNRVIRGWTEGVQLMTVGSTYEFYIPHDLAYGPGGAGGVIPPYSTLIFQVELLAIE
jgi:FKBP-type peptidyl-prolyl cis-trans isomerase FklB